MNQFLVIEIQTFETGRVATNTFGFDDPNKTREENRRAALAKLHSLLAIAAVSTLPCYSVVCLDNCGTRIAGDCYTNE